MTESAFDARSAGALLRAAREKQGLHIAALAAAIKVSPRKLDALEHDRWDELPDATFIRALAQTVCRSLKIDSGPVLELLPRSTALSLEPASGRLNAPFFERPGRDDPSLTLSTVRPMVLAASVLMLAAVLIYALPERVWQGGWLPGAAQSGEASSVSVAASAAVDGVLPAQAMPALAAASAAFAPVPLVPTPPAPAASPATATTAPVPTPAPVLASAVLAAPPAPLAASTVVAPPNPALASGQALRVQASDASWVEVRDGAGRTLLSRMVQAGEILDLDGAKPLRAIIGNAAGTKLSWRGQSVDLQPLTRGNVAHVELP